jgi:hypothetical protein
MAIQVNGPGKASGTHVLGMGGRAANPVSRSAVAASAD